MSCIIELKTAPDMLGDHPVKQRTHNLRTMGIDNWPCRTNVYPVYYILQNGPVKGIKSSIFGSAIPFNV